MKILEICTFSAGICGVWSRVREESMRLAKKGHKIRIFTSNHVKGTEELASSKDKISNIEITRFPARYLGGESFIWWNYEKQALDFEPDVIIVHNYRQPYTTQALKIANKLRKQKEVKVFLVTHAPFVEGNITRSWLATQIVKLYDFIIGPATINKFDGVVTISHWEEPYLKKIGLKQGKMHYIPNGIPEEFFTYKKSKESRKILFLGRIALKKKLETLLQAIPFLEDKSIKIEIVGPPEAEYSSYLKNIVDKLRIKDRVTFSKPIFDTKEKIKKIDSAMVYVLPSRVEGMPQSLIEAMAREKIVVGSDSIAIRDLIKNNKNGYLFEFDNPRSLASVLNKAINQKTKVIQRNARNSVEHFEWNNIITKIESLINS